MTHRLLLLEPGDPVPQGQRIVRPQPLQIMDFETGALHPELDVADAVQLAVGEHVAVDDFGGHRLFPALRVVRDGVIEEAIFISCTNLATLDVIAQIERDLGKPVVTSNQACFWACLRLLGLRDSISGHGRLLEQCLDPIDASSCAMTPKLKQA